jgi:antimicrobial peptide system SdpB family protein
MRLSKKYFISFLGVTQPWTNVYGFSRSILATGTLLTMTLNSTDVLFKQTAIRAGYCDQFGISLFCIFENLLIGKLISIIILALVITGWRPRITGVFHFWVMYSFINSATILDGGDHIALILSALLLPISITDNRKWHWELPNQGTNPNTIYGIRYLIAKSSLLFIRIQVSVIYLNSAAAKLTVKEWVDGTAVYYWFKHPLFGYPNWLNPFIEPLLLNGTTLFFITWGTITFEFLLFAGLLMDTRYKKIFLIAGIIFHFGIFLVHDLTSFLFTMVSCLVLYLRPISYPFKFPKNYTDFKNLVYGTINYSGNPFVDRGYSL